MAMRTKLYEYYDGFCEYMEKDTRGVEIGIFVTSGVLFALAYNRIRPVTKFGKASDIPNQFIRKKLKQYGSIDSTTQNLDPRATGGPLLLINHRPPLNFLVPSRKLLPVKLIGISVNANGYSWLQTVASGHDVEFIPLVKHQYSVECQVLMLCPNNKRQRLDLSEALLSLGFGKIVNPPAELKEDPVVRRYYKYLQYIEKNAKDERQGLWALSLPPVSLIRLIKNACKSAILQILPANRRLPELVR